MSDRTDVFISSTARDLPDHRKQAEEACLRMGMFPIMMEHLPASDSDAITDSLKMVDDAEIYVGIFAYRYGHIPAGHEISITEMEYNRAVKRGIPRLIFIMGDEHPIKGGDVETGAGAAKVAALKDRLKSENIVNFFDSPADFRAKLIHALSDHRQPRHEIHHVNVMTTPPDPYIAHRYTLLPKVGLVGRNRELNWLTDWVAKKNSSLYPVRMLNIVAIGGMGKSALTWKWFNDIAPHEMQPLAGRFWWSFYESDARFENFVIRALAYVSRRTIEEVEKIKPTEREDQLLAILDREPFLLVLDGLERILIAYNRLDAAYLADDDLDRDTANYVAKAWGLPDSAAETYLRRHDLRKTVDPRAGLFLQRLAACRAAKILVSTRLYPTDLQTFTGEPMPGCGAIFLQGLSDDDALALWRGAGVTGSRDQLLPLFQSFENYPLLIQALAGEVARYRREPGNFDTWRASNPNFNPASLPLIQRKSHVLHYALQDLGESARKTLHTIAAFRMPATYDALSSVLIGADQVFQTEQQLDDCLTELEDRGLIGWDRKANRYDLHPIVRGVTWDKLAQTDKQTVYENLHGYFEAVPMKDEDEVESLDDLTPAIELYHALVGLGRYDDACDVFYARLASATLYRLSANRQNIELLERLFPNGIDQPPRLQDEAWQAWTMNALALAYDASGQPGAAAPLYQGYISISEKREDAREISIGLGNLANALRLSGQLGAAEAAARRALIITREQDNQFDEAISLYYLGLVLAARLPVAAPDEIALRRSLKLWQAQRDKQGQGTASAFLAQAAIWRGDFKAARILADRAWRLAHHQRNERDFILSARLQGTAALNLGDLDRADERLHHALMRARAVSFVEEELPALVGLAALARRRGHPDQARERLAEMWELAERGPYPPFHADGLNMLAHIEREANNHDAAVEAATRACELSWCDGISADGEHYFAYAPGLETAKAHLIALGAPIPALPPFNPAAHDPMPEVEINLRDEFHITAEELQHPPA